MLHHTFSLLSNSTRWTHHKLLSQFVGNEVQALRMLGGGDRLPTWHHHVSWQQLVDLIEDLSELRSRVAGDLTDGDSSSFLELQLQLLCLRREMLFLPHVTFPTPRLKRLSPLHYKYSCREDEPTWTSFGELSCSKDWAHWAAESCNSLYHFIVPSSALFCSPVRRSKDTKMLSSSNNCVDCSHPV